MKLAIIADIHSNLEALNAVLDQVQMLGIKNIVCAGDIVGYGANPNECCNLIKKLNIPCTMGNHDINAVNLQNLDWYNGFARAALKWTNKQLTTENKDFLAKLPKMNSIKIEDKTLLIVHGSLDDPLYDYVKPDSSDARLLDFIIRSKSNILIMGHTHLPMSRKIEHGTIINPGAIGQPRDNNPKASYAILDSTLNRVTINRVKYDIETASKKIISAGLPRYLAERLFKGI